MSTSLYDLTAEYKVAAEQLSDMEGVEQTRRHLCQAERES